MTWIATIGPVEVAAAHSNGPPGQKCYNMHGHDWKVTVQFGFARLDEYGWGPGFGEVKALIREYDHQNLNDMVSPPSAEVFAQTLYDRLLGAFRIAPTFVEVEEAAGNVVRYYE